MTRMSITNTPRTATVDDAADISRTLARAFADDPMMCWFFPDEATRAEGLARYFETLFTLHYGRHGVCERTDLAAAFWVAPGGRALPDEQTLDALGAVLGDRAPLFREGIEAAAEHAPPEEHWYLAVVGADPDGQGQGHGAALLRSGLAQADAAGLPVYLESSKEANLPFYEHLGFTVLGEAQLPGGGPTLWVMRRAPRG
ncbi:GNAT family N-acetyltransferase [Streptomyces sp. NPDC001591]|uniref:GNAT family N-acetyltransferase n=1 Tax=Streptomyces sp. NPDC001591 TaxID=3364589 RepID=UPI0036C4748E